MPYLCTGLILLIILMFCIKGTLSAAYHSTDAQVKVQVTVFKRFNRIYTYQIRGTQFILSQLHNSNSSNKKPSKIPNSQYFKMLLIFLKHLYVEEFRWQTTIGTGDAMYTALGTGSLWALKGTIIGCFSSMSSIKNIKVDIKPDFQGSSIYSDLYCIFKIRMVHIMLIAIHIICFKIRRYLNGYTAAGKAQPSH